jgi:dihydroorotase
VDLDLAINTIHEHADVIIGIKVRASCDAGGANTDNALAIAREAADKVGLPLMIHLGPAPSDVDTILENLGSGDILTHSFTGWRGNTLLDDGKPRKAFQSAVKRGVNIDVGHGAGGFDSTVAKSILNHGFLPDTISTDLHSGSIGKVLSLANVMSKFLALGMSLEEVLHCTITKPNQIAGFRHIEDQFSIGNPATFTLFEIEEGQFNFADVHGHNFSGNVRIKPTFTIHNGEIISNSLQDLE